MNNKINEWLKNINAEALTGEDKERGKYEELPDGFYLCDVENLEFTQSSKGDDMFKWTFRIVENGIFIDEDGERAYNEYTANKCIWIYSVIKDQKGLEKFLNDLLKFEDANTKEKILSRACFKDLDTIKEFAPAVLGARIWVHIETDKKGNAWKYILSWKAAETNNLV